MQRVTSPRRLLKKQFFHRALKVMKKKPEKDPKKEEKKEKEKDRTKSDSSKEEEKRGKKEKKKEPEDTKKEKSVCQHTRLHEPAAIAPVMVQRLTEICILQNKSHCTLSQRRKSSRTLCRSWF